MRQVNFGMIGGGTVGSGVFHHLRQNGALLESRLGLKISLRKIAVKALDEPRPYPIPAGADDHRLGGGGAMIRRRKWSSSWSAAPPSPRR